MVVKYCENCGGKPYTLDLAMSVCPVCNSDLETEIVDDSELTSRPVINGSTNQVTDGYDYTDAQNGLDINRNGGQPAVQDNDSTVVISQPSTPVPSVPGNLISGRVSKYSSTGGEDGNYRRLLPVKLFQAIVYKQRFEDVLHRFTVRVENHDAMGYVQYTDIPVNVHGTIAGGMQIMDDEEVEVHGKYCNGILMADSVCVINNGYRSQVSFQRSIGGIALAITLAVLLIGACYVAATVGEDFLTNIATFFIGWVANFILLTVLYFILNLTRIGIALNMFRGKRRFPGVAILIISAILSMVILNIPGFFV